MRDGVIFTAYVPQPGNPVFMTLIEKTLGTEHHAHLGDGEEVRGSLNQVPSLGITS